MVTREMPERMDSSSGPQSTRMLSAPGEVSACSIAGSTFGAAVSPEAVDAIVGTVGADPTSSEQPMVGLVNPPIVPEGQRALTVWWD